LIGEAILDDESYGQGNDAMGVMGLGQGLCGRVRVEEPVVLRAAMLRVAKFDVARPSGNDIAHVLQQAGSGPIAKA
jgi:hypothetical protein